MKTKEDEEDGKDEAGGQVVEDYSIET